MTVLKSLQRPQTMIHGVLTLIVSWQMSGWWHIPFLVLLPPHGVWKRHHETRSARSKRHQEVKDNLVCLRLIVCQYTLEHGNFKKKKGRGSVGNLVGCYLPSDHKFVFSNLILYFNLVSSDLGTCGRAASGREDIEKKSTKYSKLKGWHRTKINQ